MRGRIAVTTCAMALTATTASAWWAIWPPEPEQEPPPPPPPPPVSALRDGECGTDINALAAFGETAHMRGTSLIAIPEALATALDGAAIAQSAEMVEQTLAPFLRAPDPALRQYTKSSLVLFLARRGGPNGPNAARIADLLADPDLTGDSDAAYFRAAKALLQKDWPEAQAAASQALVGNPQFYNARVVLALAELAEQSSDYRSGQLSCPALLSRMQASLIPLLQIGACPTHVAHFDLAARRFLPNDTVDANQLPFRMRQLILSYVARNDGYCTRIKADLTSELGNTACTNLVAAFTCETSGQ